MIGRSPLPQAWLLAWPLLAAAAVGGPSAPVALLYGIAAAFQQDLGCVIGAAIFFALISGSVVFAAQLTPCTSAAGIPCSH